MHIGPGQALPIGNAATRRRLLTAAGGAALVPFVEALTGGSAAWAQRMPMRVGLTPANLHHQHPMLAQWQQYLGTRLEGPVELNHRVRYRQVLDPLRLDQLDFAWIGPYAYLRLQRQVRLLAVPLYRDQPLTQAYLITNQSNRQVSSLAQLRGAIFAFVDPDSNSGHLVPRYLLSRSGESASSFFQRTFFTYSHLKAVDAVASGLADAAMVDGHFYDTLRLQRPELTVRTRVAQAAGPFGSSPFVAHASVAKAIQDRMQQTLLAMARDTDGAAILRQLNLDGFTAAPAGLHDDVRQMMRTLGER